MSLLRPILKEASRISKKKTNTETSLEAGILEQKEALTTLLSSAKSTLFGKEFGFAEIIGSEKILDTYRYQVPIFQYDFMFKKFWHKTLSGVENVSWPGKIDNFALTSGTTNSASKRIPVSEEMIKSIKQSCLKQLFSLANTNLPVNFFVKKVLCVGGSNNLTEINNIKEGDLSGILTGRLPSWLNPFTKPNKKIRSIEDWETKLEEIVKNAHRWDIGIICGVPSWIGLLLRRIKDYYKTDSIFTIWPNLKFYIHGGVAFDPYIQSFNELFEEKVVYLDTYLASEGFIGYQPTDSDSLELITNSGIYYEFVPFNSNHFDENGNLIDFQHALTIEEVIEEEQYALLITTNAGAFRYLIGDTIKFTDLEKLKFKITGRTKHFLSLCGEHLSVDNMTQAVTELALEQGVSIEEFAVTGKITPAENFMHHWYIATDSPINAVNFKYDLDEKLKELNTDYRVERNFALQDIIVDILPTKVFYDFLKIKDKYGAQHKFPRVLKGKLAEDWKRYLDHLKVTRGSKKYKQLVLVRND